MKQQGFSLIIVLLLLTIMVGLATTALHTAGADARLQVGERDRQLAFEAAEAALRDGEAWLRAGAPAAARFDAECSAGLCLPSADGTPQWRRVDWNGTAPIRYGHGEAVFPQAGLLREPRYIIEALPELAAGTPYRITAAGWGRNPASEVRLQSVYLAGGAMPARRLSWRQDH